MTAMVAGPAKETARATQIADGIALAWCRACRESIAAALLLVQS